MPRTSKKLVEKLTRAKLEASKSQVSIQLTPVTPAVIRSYGAAVSEPMPQISKRQGFRKRKSPAKEKESPIKPKKSPVKPVRRGNRVRGMSEKALYSLATRKSPTKKGSLKEPAKRGRPAHSATPKHATNSGVLSPEAVAQAKRPSPVKTRRTVQTRRAATAAAAAKTATPPAAKTAKSAFIETPVPTSTGKLEPPSIAQVSSTSVSKRSSASGPKKPDTRKRSHAPVKELAASPAKISRTPVSKKVATPIKPSAYASKKSVVSQLQKQPAGTPKDSSSTLKKLSSVIAKPERRRSLKTPSSGSVDTPKNSATTKKKQISSVVKPERRRSLKQPSSGSTLAHKSKQAFTRLVNSPLEDKFMTPDCGVTGKSRSSTTTTKSTKAGKTVSVHQHVVASGGRGTPRMRKSATKGNNTKKSASASRKKMAARKQLTRPSKSLSKSVQAMDTDMQLLECESAGLDSALSSPSPQKYKTPMVSLGSPGEPISFSKGSSPLLRKRDPPTEAYSGLIEHSSPGKSGAETGECFEVNYNANANADDEQTRQDKTRCSVM